MKRALFILIFFILSAQAATNMWTRSAEAYGIDPRLLYAISKVESNIRPFVISVNFRKITRTQRERLYSVLRQKNIPFNTYTKVIEINSQNLTQAQEMIAFLDQNRYPSFDIGLMQVNNIHKQRLLSHGIPLNALLQEETNINVASEILWECYKKYRSNNKAINAYNGKLAGNPYYSKVSAELRKLLLPHENSSKRLFYRIS
ncbi:MAG: lytic transglycosylase domain-containing protein [Sulfurimonas sp.]|jgi:soluble lytic murein transglycosylase-like protein|nr:lytic transglycosylase domain-containing protein [Sulfurimonas sp.]MDD5202701.1 lytic transglycosylase domain-containing protein [Sulfurimonas sp.]